MCLMSSSFIAFHNFVIFYVMSKKQDWMLILIKTVDFKMDVILKKSKNSLK